MLSFKQIKLCLVTHTFCILSTQVFIFWSANGVKTYPVNSQAKSIKGQIKVSLVTQHSPSHVIIGILHALLIPKIKGKFLQHFWNLWKFEIFESLKMWNSRQVSQPNTEIILLVDMPCLLAMSLNLLIGYTW
jgi:hypothetical protein